MLVSVTIKLSTHHSLIERKDFTEVIIHAKHFLHRSHQGPLHTKTDPQHSPLRTCSSSPSRPLLPPPASPGPSILPCPKNKASALLFCPLHHFRGGHSLCPPRHHSCNPGRGAVHHTDSREGGSEDVWQAHHDNKERDWQRKGMQQSFSGTNLAFFEALFPFQARLPEVYQADCWFS